MKRLAVTAVALTALLVGCQKQHPISVFVAPAMQKGPAEKIAVFPFGSALHQADDPDGEAPATMAKFFTPELDARADYTFIAPSTVLYAAEQEGMQERYREFLEQYPMDNEADVELLQKLGNILKCDAFLFPVVDTWQKDEVDAQENATPATYVGATITILGKEDGKVLFRATDEDYLEGARSETGDRSLVTGGSGAIRSDLGAKVHRAPPYEDVAIKVAQALAGSLPVR